MLIRQARPQENSQLITIWRRSVEATHHFLSDFHRIEIEAQVRDFLPQVPVWVAEDQQSQQPVALMVLSDQHLEALFIDPQQRGTGIGRKLVAHALSLHPKLTTDVNEQNIQALGFYQKLGFNIMGRSATDGSGRPYPLLHLSYQHKM